MRLKFLNIILCIVYRNLLNRLKNHPRPTIKELAPLTLLESPFHRLKSTWYPEILANLI